MVFAISQEQRADLVGRVADGLAGIGFHSYGLTLEAGSLKDKAEEIEARAFSVAEVASSTTKESWSAGTGGERPIAELIKLYAKKAGELMRDEALRLSETAKDASPAGGEAAADDAEDVNVADRPCGVSRRVALASSNRGASASCFALRRASSASRPARRRPPTARL